MRDLANHLGAHARLLVNHLGLLLGEIDALDGQVVDVPVVSGGPLHATPDADVGVKIAAHDLGHLGQRRVRGDLAVVGGAEVADVEHRVGDHEAALTLQLLPQHIADHLAVAAVVELGFKVERDHDLLARGRLVVSTRRIGLGNLLVGQSDGVACRRLLDLYLLFSLRRTGQVLRSQLLDVILIGPAQLIEGDHGGPAILFLEAYVAVHQADEFGGSQDLAGGVGPISHGALVIACGRCGRSLFGFPLRLLGRELPLEVLDAARGFQQFVGFGCQLAFSLSGLESCVLVRGFLRRAAAGDECDDQQEEKKANCHRLASFALLFRRGTLPRSRRRCEYRCLAADGTSAQPSPGPRRRAVG